MSPRLFTHTVRVPPLTDVRELVSQYHTLFSSLGIPVADAFPPSTQGFTHPIPEENQRMTMEFFGTMQVMKGTMQQFKSLKLTNTRVQNSTVTFIFEVTE